MDTLKYKIARLIGTMEIPIVYMLLSLQSSDQMWRTTWFIISIYKFTVNVVADHFVHKHKEDVIKAIKEINELDNNIMSEFNEGIDEARRRINNNQFNNKNKKDDKK